MKNVKNRAKYKNGSVMDLSGGLTCTVRYRVEYLVGRGTGHRYRYVWDRLAKTYGLYDRGVL